jgi:hypothetical protein
VATFEDRDGDTVYHVTIQPRAWWERKLAECGLHRAESPFTPMDFPRGSGNGPMDWSVIDDPGLGFHVVACAEPTATDLPS